MFTMTTNAYGRGAAWISAIALLVSLGALPALAQNDLRDLQRQFEEICEANEGGEVDQAAYDKCERPDVFKDVSFADIDINSDGKVDREESWAHLEAHHN